MEKETAIAKCSSFIFWSKSWEKLVRIFWLLLVLGCWPFRQKSADVSFNL